MRERSSRSMTVAVAALSAVLAVSCNQSPADPSSESRRQQQEEAITQLRSRQRLHFAIDGTPGEESLFDSGQVLPTSQFVAAARTECLYRSYLERNDLQDGAIPPASVFDEFPANGASMADAHPACGAPPTDVGSAFCELRLRHCVAEIALDVASEPGERKLLRAYSGATPSYLTVPPADAAERAGLLEFAAVYLGNEETWLLITEGLAAQNVVGCGSSTLCASAFSPGSSSRGTTTLFHAVPALLRLIENTALEATREAAEKLVALADERLGKSADQRKSHREMMAIRAHAAGLAYGWAGYDGPSLKVDIFGNPDPIAPRVQRAIDLVREAAPSPAAVVGAAGSIGPASRWYALPPSVDSAFVNDVLARLRRHRSNPNLELGDLGVASADIVAARRRLNEEALIFMRSLRMAEDGSETDPWQNPDARFEGTKRLPARSTPSGLFSVHVTRLSDDDGGTGYARLMHALQGWGQGVLGQVYGQVVPATDERIADSVRLTSAIFEDAPGVAQLYWSSEDSAWGFAATLPGSLTSKDVVLLATDGAPADVADVVRCATLGTTEGHPCMSFGPPESYKFNGPADLPVRFGYGPYVGSGEQVYLLIRKAGMRGAGEMRPGQYDLVFSATLGGGEWQGTSGLHPILPMIEAEVAEVLRPSTTAPGEANLSCAGLEVDENIPLINLREEQGVEPSEAWRSYLTRAGELAREADLLGETALLESNELAAASEAALSDLRDLCGASLDVELIRGLMSAHPEVTDPVQLLGFLPSDGSDPDVERLKQCLLTGTGQVVPHVSLGSQPLCAWQYGNDPHTTCQGGSTVAGQACPVEMRNGSCDGLLPPLDAGWQPITVQGDELLGYFDSHKSSLQGGDNPTTPETCRNLRRLFTAAGNWTETTAPTFDVQNYWALAMQNAAYLDDERARKAAARITWEADFGGYSSVRVDGIPLLATGNRNDGPGAGDMAPCWHPLLTTDDTCAPNGSPEQTLLCASVACGDDDARARMNGRMAAAAIFARWLAGDDMSGFLVPQLEFQSPPTNVESNFGRFDDLYTLRTFWLDSHTNPVVPIQYGCVVQPHAPLWTWRQAGGGSTPSVDYDTTCGQKVSGLVRLAGSGWIPYTTSLIRLLSTSERNTEAARAAQWRMDLQVRGAGPDRDSAGRPAATPLHVISRAADALYGANGPNIRSYATVGSKSAANYAVMLNLSQTWSGGRVRRQVILDALELLCHVTATERPTSECTAAEPPSYPNSGDNFEFAARRAECVAEGIRRQATRSIFVNVPRPAMDALREHSTLGAAFATHGQYGESVATLRNAFTRLNQAAETVVLETEGLARAIRTTRIALDNLSLQQEQARNAMMASVATRALSCATSMNPTQWVESAAGCAAAAISISADIRNYRLGQKITNNMETQALLSLEEEADRRAQALLAVSSAVTQDSDGVDATLMRIDAIRRRGQGAYRRALGLESDDTGRLLSTVAFSHARLNTANIRYQRALVSARRMAFLAKRAIEERFAVRLSDLTAPVAGMAAPAEWESNVCTLTGLDYQRIVDGTRTNLDYSYADQYIGDYVRNLEDFVVAYQQEFSFLPATESIVVSLRDDVLRVRDTCESGLESRNLLVSSNDLGSFTAAGSRGWRPFGCNSATNCVSAERIGLTLGSSVGSADPEGPALYSARFGIPIDSCYPTMTSSCPCWAETCGWVPEASIAQTVDIDAGTYRVSWFAPAMAAGETWRDDVVWVTDSSGATRFGSTPVQHATWPSASSMVRYWYDVEVPSAQTVVVQVRNPSGTFESSHVLGGLMLERLFSLTSEPPSPFVATDSQGLVQSLPLCEDTDGSAFRANGWTRRCETACPSGQNGTCETWQMIQTCYHELSFGLTNEGIEAGTTFAASGFARGNFNYRIRALALNAVGSGLRDCDASPTPTTCYATGTLRYDLEHLGPFLERGWDDRLFVSHVDPGIIHNGQALASERYITNPISGSDSALIEQYRHRELRGRPLAGRYVVRIPDQAGIDFDALEDLQLVLTYDYWTRAR